MDWRAPSAPRAHIPRKSGLPFVKLNTDVVRSVIEDVLAPTACVPEHLESHGWFFFSFPGFCKNWRPPYRVGIDADVHGVGGWHVDVGYEIVETYDLSSGNCGIVPVFLLTTTRSRGGATVLLPGSHRVVARLLHAAGGRLPRAHMTAFCEHLATEKTEIVEATGDAGDLYLLHPLLIHSASHNSHDSVRVMCSTGIGLVGPRRFMLDGEHHSLCDRAIRDAINGHHHHALSALRLKSGI